MFQLDLKSRESIYEQIISQIKELIITGIIKENEKLPSVRELSKILTVNPNTVQKSYRELERQGYVYTVAGLGCFAASISDIRRDANTVRHLKEALSNTLRQLACLGFTKKELQELTEQCISQVPQRKEPETSTKGSETL